MGVNCVMLSGNLLRDAEFKEKEGAVDVLCFSIACDRRERDPLTGEWHKGLPDIFSCNVFGNRARALRPYLKKGSKLCVAGRLKYSTYSTESGETRSSVSVFVNELEFLSRADIDEETRPQIDDSK